MPGIGTHKVSGDGGMRMCDYVEAKKMTKEEEMQWQIDNLTDRIHDKERQIAYFIEKLPEMELKEGQKEEWERIVEVNKDDEYSKAVVDVAEMMAKVLQTVKDSPENKDDLAYHVMCMVDPYGITGFQADCVYSILRKVWRYGEDFFRRE